MFVRFGRVEEEEESDAEALESCAAEGGTSAIVYNSNNQATENDTLYVPNSQIPAVCVSKTSANSLLEKFEVTSGNFNVTIGDEGNDNVEYTFAWMSGSSMAAPHVTTSAALLKSHYYYFVL
jgi:subtilisin family serine protease